VEHNKLIEIFINVSSSDPGKEKKPKLGINGTNAHEFESDRGFLVHV
jgi:hypothetical protein